MIIEEKLTEEQRQYIDKVIKDANQRDLKKLHKQIFNDTTSEEKRELMQNAIAESVENRINREFKMNWESLYGRR